MRIGSLFSGIGGLDLGIEAATGGSVAWLCEKDPFCRSELARHWPGVTIFEDVVGLEPPPCDVLIGGFPCIDVSQAGKREGIQDGNSSGLWLEYARIIRLLRPGLVFVENVRALTFPGRGFDHVLSGLARSGYDAQWTVLGACCVGARHRRERLFLLSYPQGGVSDAVRDTLREQWQRHRKQRREPGPAVAGDDGAHGGVARRATHPWTSEPAVGRVVDGFPGRLAQLGALGNAVAPAQAEAAFWILAARMLQQLSLTP